jgi:hypothetical protein
MFILKKASDPQTPTGDVVNITVRAIAKIGGTMDSSTFDVKAFTEAAGFRPWPYSANTYRDGAGRYLDWQKAGTLLVLERCAFLLSAYDAVHQCNRLWPFPAPRTMAEAMGMLEAIGQSEGLDAKHITVRHPDDDDKPHRKPAKGGETIE